jgi:hypothetical protein
MGAWFTTFGFDRVDHNNGVIEWCASFTLETKSCANRGQRSMHLAQFVRALGFCLFLGLGCWLVVGCGSEGPTVSSDTGAPKPKERQELQKKALKDARKEMATDKPARKRTPGG